MKTFVQSLIVALFVLTMSVPVEAKATTGNDLVSYCADEPDASSLYYLCTGLIIGFKNGIEFALALRKDEPMFCIPEEVTRQQIIRVVVKYLEEYPERLHIGYPSLVLLALEKAFPCKETEPNAK